METMIEYNRLDVNRDDKCHRMYLKISNLITIGLMVTLIVLYVKIVNDNSNLTNKNDNVENRMSLLETGFSVIISNVQNQILMMNEIQKESSASLEKIQNISSTLISKTDNITNTLLEMFKIFNPFKDLTYVNGDGVSDYVFNKSLCHHGFILLASCYPCIITADQINIPGKIVSASSLYNYISFNNGCDINIIHSTSVMNQFWIFYL